MCGLAPSGILGAIRYVAGGWDAATIRCLPSGTVQVLTGTSPHGQGHETAWSQITADELGYDGRRDRGAARRHDRQPARDGHRTAAAASRSAGSRSTTRPRRSSRRRGRSRRTSSASTRDELAYEGGTFSTADAAVTIKELAFAAWSAHDLPPGLRAGPRGDRRLRPAELQLAGRRARRVVEIDTGDRRRASCSATSRSTTSARSSTR